MPISNKTSQLLPLIALFLTTSLLILHKADSAVSFSYSSFDPKDSHDLIFQGDAKITPRASLVQLTNVDSNGTPLTARVGRVLHTTPVPLRDSSGRVAGFTTSFVFRITATGGSNPAADGLAFFLASPDSTIPPGSNGALLGLFGNSNALNNTRKELTGFRASSSSSAGVVAVEFDTYPNTNIGDPDYRHVGVDVNSIRSRVTKEWEWVNGDPVAVTISYDPYGKELRVLASHFSGPRVEVSYEVDLSTVLPEQVRVGFSASTGAYAQINEVLSWSFFSNLGRSRAQMESGYIASVV